MYIQIILFKVQFDAAEMPVGGMNCGSGAALDDSNGDLETRKN